MKYRHLIFGLALLAIGSSFARAKDTAKPHEIVVKWEDHGEEKICHTSAVRIERQGHPFPVKSTKHGILLSPTLERRATDAKTRLMPMSLRVSCDGLTLEFPQVYSSWFQRGYWTFGFDYPPFAHAIGHAVPERGTWISYFDFETTGDGPEMSIAHDEPFPGLSEKIVQHHPQNSNDDRYADWYARAVLGVDYQKNRDLLLTNFRRCSTMTVTDSDDCQSALGEYLINLYWRGDDSLLRPMMEAAADKVDVLSEMGWLYGTLLTRRPQIAMSVLKNLPEEKRNIICRQAGEDEFWSVPDYKKSEIGKAMTALGTVGDACWAVAAAASKHPYGN